MPYVMRFSSEIEHLKDFLNGKVYMNRIEEFRKSSVPEQGDPFDGGVKIPYPLITIKDSLENYYKAKEVFVTIDINCPIYCFSIVSNDEFESNFEYRKYVKDVYKSKYILDIRDFPSFVEDFVRFCDNHDYWRHGDYVEYVDFEKADFPIEKDFVYEYLFLKEKKYEMQHEYRIIIDDESIRNNSGAFIIDLNKKYHGIIYEIQDDYSLKEVYNNDQYRYVTY